MRILQAIANKSRIGRLFIGEPRMFTPVEPTADELEVRRILRLDRDDAEASEVLRGLSYALRSEAHRLSGVLRDEVELIAASFLNQGAPGTSGAALVTGSLRNIHNLFPAQWPLHGAVTLSPSNPYAPINPDSFRVVLKSRVGSVLASASASGLTLRVDLGAPDETTALELEEALAPATHVGIFAPQDFPYAEVLALLAGSGGMSALLSAAGYAGLYESLPDAVGKVAVIAAALAKRGLDG